MSNVNDSGNNNAGAGNDGGQNQNSGDGNANSNGDAGNRQLSTNDIQALTDTIVAQATPVILDAVKSQNHEFLKNDVSQQITGAVKRQVSEYAKSTSNNLGNENAGNDNANKGGSGYGELLNQMVDMPDGRKVTVADLAKANMDAQAKLEEVAAQDAQRQRQDMSLKIKGGLQSRNVLPESLDLVGDGIAAKCQIDDNGNIIAKNVQVPNPLNVEPRMLVKDMPLEEYLDFVVTTNKNLVASTIKQGSGSTGGSGAGSGQNGKYKAEDAYLDPTLLDRWRDEDPEGCAKAMADYRKKVAKERTFSLSKMRD